MATIDYEKAYKSGRKNYQFKVLQQKKPTLQVLDDILPPKGSYSEVPLGLVNIPIDQIVGTKTNARSNAFASNFMPILDADTEFAHKWISLSDSHLEEGIRDPIKAYEFMNKFYVEEGNKRVSVLKYFDVDSIPGYVTRIIPKRTDDLENKIYYEFLDFYNLTKINYIYFTKEGSFEKLIELVGKKPGEPWTEDDCIDFRSIYYRFSSQYKTKEHHLSITPGDAFLAFLKLHDYKEICDMPIKELNTLIDKTWEDFVLLTKEQNIDLKVDPSSEKKNLFIRLLSPGIQNLKIAFINDKTPSTSSWTYAHELGRMHLEQTFSDNVRTIRYDNTSIDTVKDTIEKAVSEGCNIIFTTSAAFAPASVKAAIDHPDVRILNCSVHTSHRYIRTYYARMHEAKFLMGAIAGAMAENDKLIYIADYPIHGTIANINAFALGAKMINPRAKVYLEWPCTKNCDIDVDIARIQPSCISGKDMIIPDEASRYFGIYHMSDGEPVNLAMPLLHWGKFYEQLIRTIMNGTWKYDDNPSEKKAINYWWGMSAGVVDVICSRNLPIGTQRLVDLLKKTICRGEFNPFTGILYSQDGVIQSDPYRNLSPEEIVTMDWLAENIVGHIPTEDELLENALPLFSQQGIEKKG